MGDRIETSFGTLVLNGKRSSRSIHFNHKQMTPSLRIKLLLESMVNKKYFVPRLQDLVIAVLPAGVACALALKYYARFGFDSEDIRQALLSFCLSYLSVIFLASISASVYLRVNPINEQDLACVKLALSKKVDNLKTKDDNSGKTTPKGKEARAGEKKEDSHSDENVSEEAPTAATTSGDCKTPQGIKPPSSEKKNVKSN